MSNNIQKIKEMTQPLATLLGENLSGIYLHGSQAMECNTADSDIDLLIIINQPEETSEYRQIIDILINLKGLPKKGIELSVVLRQYCDDFEYPTPFELHYSNAHCQLYSNNPHYLCGGTTDNDLAAHFKVAKERGICLYGAPIVELFPDIPHAIYWDSVKSDLIDAEVAIQNDPVYHILNYCRSLYYLRTRKIASKVEGGEWANSHIAPTYRPLVQYALEQYRGANKGYVWSTNQLRAFINYMKRQFESALENK